MTPAPTSAPSDVLMIKLPVAVWAELIGLLFALALQEPDRQPQARELAHQLYTAYLRASAAGCPITALTDPSGQTERQVLGDG